MRKFLLILIALSLLIAGCGGDTGDSSKSSAGAQSTTISGSPTMTIDASGGEKVEVRVEIADNPAEQEKGLMDRTTMSEDRGMLFVFPDEKTRIFWMKNTLIPLSIAYMDSKGRIVDIQKMAAPDKTVPDDDLPRYISAKPARYALEANEGFFKEHGVEVGDRADLPG